ncbi:hypothetical protein BDW62DRAFT_178415 [Aspergillus aurantiobrunneus]
MQRIWFRSAPAAPTSLCTSCLSTAATEGLVSRTTPTTSKRSLRTGNSVTALHTNISAVVALTDARAKGRRRCERDEKFAPVKEEINELIDREQRLWRASYSRRTTNPLRRALQTRSFHTLPRPTYPNAQLRDTRPPRRLSHSLNNGAPVNGEFSDPALRELESENITRMMEDGNDFDMAIDVEDAPDWLRTDLVRAKAIKRLALKQLAIRLILRPAIAHSYFGILKNYEDADADAYPPLDIPGLLFELNAIRRRIRQIKANPAVNIDDLVKDIRARQLKDMVLGGRKIDGQVRRDTSLYLSNEMHLEELLLRLSSLLLEAKDPDQPYAFTMMIIAFTKTRQNDLAGLVIKTILPYKFELRSSLILAIINFFRKTKDLKGFDLFLKMLEGKGYPIDMGNLGFYKTRVVNNLQISVPPVHSANIVVYAALIRACLRFDQPDRADAYLLVARAAGCMDDFAILMAYLEFYTIRGNWEKGVQVLRRASAYVASTTEHPLERVERLIVMMVQLCDSCHMFEVSNALIQAAVDSGFSSDIPKKQEDLVLDADPESERWQVAAQNATAPNMYQTLGDQCYAFAKNARKYLDALAVPNKRRSYRLNKLMGTYSHQVLSTVLDGRLGQETAGRGNQPEQPGNDKRSDEDTETDYEGPTTSSEHMMAAQQHEIGALKTEVAELKQMVLRLYQPMAAATTPPSSGPDDPSNLKQRLAPSTPTSGEAPPQDKIAGAVSS